MNHDKHIEVDQSILAAIADGMNEFYMIDARINDCDFRLIDRRLQAMRKRGLISYTRKTGWRMAK